MLKFQNRMAIYEDDQQSCQIFFPTSDMGRHISVKQVYDTYIEIEYYGESDCVDFTHLAENLKGDIMIPNITERENQLLESCDFSVDGVYITYILSNEKPTLKVEVLTDSQHEATLSLVGDYFEVITSTLSELDIYRVKFTVERNADLLMSGWEEAHARLFEK